MQDLTASQVTLLVTAVGVISAFVGWLGRGFSFAAKRWWTAAPKQENASYLNSVADLAAKLRSTGMTMADVRQLEAAMLSTSVASSEAATKMVEGLAADEGPDSLKSNVALKARAGTAYAVAEAQLEQALMDLRLIVGEGDWQVVERLQDRWREYRSAVEDWHLRQYGNGTHATLALVLAGLAETERRTAEVRAEIAERLGR